MGIHRRWHCEKAFDWRKLKAVMQEPHSSPSRLAFAVRAGRLDRFCTASQSSEEVWLLDDGDLQPRPAGSKARRLHSILAAAKEEQIDGVIVQGSSGANACVAAVVALRQAGLSLHLLASGRSMTWPRLGNGRWLAQHVAAHEVTFVATSTTRAAEIEAIAIRRGFRNWIALGEGLAHPSAESGARTLGHDLWQAYRQVKFSSVALEWGTGWTARGLVEGWGECTALPLPRLILLDVVGRQNEVALVDRDGRPFDTLWLRPPSAPGFGTYNRAVMQTWQHLQATTLNAWDPFYGTKLVMALEACTAAQRLCGPLMIIGTGTCFAGERIR